MPIAIKKQRPIYNIVRLQREKFQNFKKAQRTSSFSTFGSPSVDSRFLTTNQEQRSSVEYYVNRMFRMRYLGVSNSESEVL
ncbi:hypothetical protein WN51_01609 [Melipona quadrifasciata]|uniref:Uncharacterized protein n=1 Tax=Melipona quadrifasciata TaxID=166423 RepID=A0A0M8ZW94_9HYME|nr:hypothetical protein WN51_01609 [Melipona quadrifasciata]